MREARIPGFATERDSGVPNRRGSSEVPVRLYEPESAEPWATLVWAHGGGFTRGTLDWPESDWVSRRFAEAGMRVCSVDYVLASESVKAPVPANDVAAVLHWILARHDEPVLVGGASAGGHLAVAAALSVLERQSTRRADALLLIYPTLHRVQREDPRISEATAGLPQARRFDAQRIAQMYQFYLGDFEGSQSPTEIVGESPLQRLAELPPTVIVNADADDLRASGEQFAQQLREAGVPVAETVQKGTLHGFMNRPEQSPASLRDARAAIRFLVEETRAILGLAGRVPEALGAVTEPELTEATALTLPNGRLNRAAIGWARQPIVDTSAFGRGAGRNKRWEYWNACTPEHILALTVSHIDYACVHEVWVYERSTGRSWGAAATVLPPRGAVLAARLEQGRSMARAKKLSIDIDEVPGGTRLRGQIEGVSFDITAALPAGHERLAVVVPWSDIRFQYTVKDVARPASGWLRIEGEEHQLPEGESWAVLDHGRGRWPYDIRWNWGAGSGRSHGRVIGVQLGAKWTEGTGVSENAFFVDGSLHKIHGETDWQYDLADWRTPWRVRGGGLDAMFRPFHNKVTRTDLLVLRGHTDQCFGHWSGCFDTAAGERIEFEGILGWAEEVHNRW